MKKIVIVLLSMFMLSCSNDDFDKVDTSDELLIEKNKIEKVSILIGKVLSNKDVKYEVLNKIKRIGAKNSSVSLSYLLNSDSNLMKNELEQAKSFSKNNLFRDNILDEILSNTKKYSDEIGLKIKTNDKKSYSQISDDLAEELASQNLQVFFPYDPEDKNKNLEVTDFYMSYHPLEYAESNNGFKYKEGNDSYQHVDMMTNDFIDTNPVFVIVPIDECDMPDVLCGYDDLQPSNMPLDGGGFPVIMDPGEFPIYGGGGGTSATIPPSNTPGDPIGGPVLLTDNYNHSDILAGDLLTTNIPRIMIYGTKWIGFGGTHQKLIIYRGTSDGSVTQNPNGTITAKGNSYVIKEIRISRRNCRKKRWVGFNAEFDPDWTMSENTQSIAVFSIHHISSSASAELKTKSGFKLEDDNFVPTAEVSGENTISVSKGKAKLRVNFEISRKHSLATIVGNGTSGSTIESDGVHYNHKWNDRFNFYFNHYYTDLTD